MKYAILAILLCLLPACVSLPADPTKMSAEQLREWAKDKNANIACGTMMSNLGRGVMVTVVLDKGVAYNVSVDPECKITITLPPK